MQNTHSKMNMFRFFNCLESNLMKDTFSRKWRDNVKENPYGVIQKNDTNLLKENPYGVPTTLHISQLNNKT